VLDTPGTGSPGGIIWIAGSNLVVSLQTIYGTAAGSGVYKALAVSSSTLISTVVVDDTSVSNEAWKMRTQLELTCAQ
jgi:hypothetical protein